ncbi:MAG: hypothetical protein HYX79_10955 [Chloroflexi bacterium]|nr:hypothetical protein [Chloroflexota bacterium]
MTQKVRPRAYYYGIPWGGPSEYGPDILVWTGKKDVKGFNQYRFYECKLIEDWPDGVTFTMEGKRAEDYLVVGMHWTVVSDRVRKAFEECRVEGMQFLPVRIVKETGEDVGQYWALNVTHPAVDALDWERTRWLPGRNPREDEHPELCIIAEAFRFDSLKGIDIFRLKVKNQVTHLYVSQRVKWCLEQAGATSGFEFSPVPAY